MTESLKPLAIVAELAASQTIPSIYPEPFTSLMVGRDKKRLGDVFALTNFGVNLTRLAPGALSALRHAHAVQDEFIYILEGNPILVTDNNETQLQPGMCAGFKAGTGNAHQLVNRTAEEVQYLEVGDRTAGDTVNYPDDDLKADMVDGHWVFSHRNGMPY